jgi:DNA-binding transcriptional LysR family regulator
MDMELRDLEYFAVLATHGQVVRAAEALGLSQPALSLSLRRLEKSAKTKLVKRTPKGVELTAVGAALLTHVRRLRLARDDLSREVSDLVAGRAGRLCVGTGNSVAQRLLPLACAALMKDAPNLMLRVSVGATSDVLLPELRSGELDIVVNHVPNLSGQDLAFETLWMDEFVVYASVHHRLAKRKSVLLSDLSREGWVSTPGSSFQGWQALRQAFQERNLPDPRFTLVSESGPLLQHAVASEPEWVSK